MSDTIEILKIQDLEPFPDHPFQVREDDAMKETAESVKTYGILTPILVRPLENGHYQIVSGHRRTKACEMAGVEEMRKDHLRDKMGRFLAFFDLLVYNDSGRK